MSGLPPPERTSHPFWMYEMIKGIPASYKAALGQTQKLDFPRRERLVTTGNGTAFFSAWMGSQVLDGMGVSHRSVHSFELSHYDRPMEGDAVIGVSHSGITRTTVDSLRVARDAGAYTVGITHFASRPIEGVCDAVAVIGDGPDKSRCHTKTYVDSAGAVAEMALRHAIHHGKEVAELREKLEGLVSSMERVLEDSEVKARNLVDGLIPPKQVVFAAPGPNVVTAREAALKIKESSYLPSEGIELEEEMHGPWVNLDANSLLVVVSPPGPSAPRARDLLEAARKMKTTTISVGKKGLGSDFEFGLPDVDEVLTPFLAILPLYFVAYFLSVRLGHNPDYLRYLEPAYWDARQDIFPPGTH